MHAEGRAAPATATATTSSAPLSRAVGSADAGRDGQASMEPLEWESECVCVPYGYYYGRSVGNCVRSTDFFLDGAYARTWERDHMKTFYASQKITGEFEFRRVKYWGQGKGRAS